MHRADIAERRARMVTTFNGSPIGRLFGMTLRYDGEAAVLDLPYNEHLDHALGATHGGVLATLLDNAGWFTLAPFYPTWIATVEFQVRLHEPAVRRDLRARGRVVRRGWHLSVAEMEVRDMDDRLIATGSGTFARTSQKFEPLPASLGTLEP